MIRKMPNTKLSFDLFKQYFTQKDLLNHPFDELYQKLQTKQEIIDPSSKQQRFIDAYKLSADKSFSSVLYKMYENEENVAASGVSPLPPQAVSPTLISIINERKIRSLRFRFMIRPFL